MITQTCMTEMDLTCTGEYQQPGGQDTCRDPHCLHSLVCSSSGGKDEGGGDIETQAKMEGEEGKSGKKEGRKDTKNERGLKKQGAKKQHQETFSLFRVRDSQTNGRMSSRDIFHHVWRELICWVNKRCALCSNRNWKHRTAGSFIPSPRVLKLHVAGKITVIIRRLKNLAGGIDGSEKQTIKQTIGMLDKLRKFRRVEKGMILIRNY